MSTAIASTGFSQEAFDAFLSERDEPGWLSDMRRAAWHRFQDLPMPSVRDEEWMRTDIRLFKLDRFGLATPSITAPSALPHALLAAGVELGQRHPWWGSSEHSAVDRARVGKGRPSQGPVVQCETVTRFRAGDETAHTP